VDNDIEAVATALYVKVDDFLLERPELASVRSETRSIIAYDH
jgi:hypothetical protein